MRSETQTPIWPFNSGQFFKSLDVNLVPGRVLHVTRSNHIITHLIKRQNSLRENVKNAILDAIGVKLPLEYTMIRRQAGVLSSTSRRLLIGWTL